MAKLRRSENTDDLKPEDNPETDYALHLLRLHAEGFESHINLLKGFIETAEQRIVEHKAKIVAIDKTLQSCLDGINFIEEGLLERLHRSS